MMLNKAIMTLAALTFSAFALIAANQTEVNDPVEQLELSGMVMDAFSGEGIPGATVTVEENGSSATTDDFGEFTISDLEAGSYTLKVEAEGYEDGEESVDLEEDGDNRVEIELEPEYDYDDK
jgi:uncharacterized membrane protein